MSREDYVAIAARLFAVYVGLQILLQVPGIVQVVSEGQGAGAGWMIGLFLLMGVGLCIFLWFFPLTIARKLLPVMREARSEQAIDASVGLSLGLVLIGLWLLADGLIDAVYWITLVVLSRDIDPEMAFEWTPHQLASMAAKGVQLGVGAWLVLGSTRVKRMIRKARYGTLEAQ